MAGIQIRINPETVKDLRLLGDEFGGTPDDVTIRLVMSGYQRLKAENELLKMKLEQLTGDKN
ncbi:MAG: hypothetical protein PHD60_11790 [Clostridia bacterium]|nr:hypothetical protein [Clostridia bacterium]